jgi:hypothetical protein
MSAITSVWSSYGHTFMSDGEEPYESCLTCGAMYQLLPVEGDPTRGEYSANNGDEPKACTYNTSMGHGDPYECGDDPDDPNYLHDCNCVVCS